MAGIADEDDFSEQDKGPLVYQEAKVFHTEYFLLNAYDNPHRRHVTFEIYGLDTQDMFHIGYNYADFDQLFRFNAELMNPNRKEGRFHWIFERLAIVTVGKDRKLQLKPEPSEEKPELPVYETTRKIPTGRMDLKERQRLREQMDMLDIKRAENISKKRAATKQRFLEHIFMLKEEDVKRKKEVEAKIAEERKNRWKQKEEQEKADKAESIRLEELKKVRVKHVEVKEERTEEQDEEEYRQLRARWKVRDAEKAKQIEDAQAKKAAERVARLEAENQARMEKAEVQARRETVWAARGERIKRREAEVLAKVLDVKAERIRMKKLQLERNQEFIKVLHSERQPIFKAQLERTQKRVEAQKAEEEATKNYVEKRSIPKKVKKKGKNAAAGGKKPKAKKDDAEAAPEKSENLSNTEQVLDSVEAKMRKEIEEQKRRDKLEKRRENKLKEIEKARRLKEIEHIKEYREQCRQNDTGAEAKAAERKLIRQQRDEEARAAEERKAAERERLNRVREVNIARIQQQRLQRTA